VAEADGFGPKVSGHNDITINLAGTIIIATQFSATVGVLHKLCCVKSFCWCLCSSDPSCSDPMPIYAQLTKGRNLFVGQSSSNVQAESLQDGPPVQHGTDSKVTLRFSVLMLCVL